MKNYITVIVIITIAFISTPSANAGGGTKCAACGIVVGLLEETKAKSYEVNLAVGLLCGKECSKDLKKDAESMIKNQTNPDDVCGYMNVCTGNCSLFPTWPLPSLPPKPPQEGGDKVTRNK